MYLFAATGGRWNAPVMTPVDCSLCGLPTEPLTHRSALKTSNPRNNTRNNRKRSANGHATQWYGNSDRSVSRITRNMILITREIQSVIPCPVQSSLKSARYWLLFSIVVVLTRKIADERGNRAEIHDLGRQRCWRDDLMRFPAVYFSCWLHYAAVQLVRLHGNERY